MYIAFFFFFCHNRFSVLLFLLVVAGVLGLEQFDLCHVRGGSQDYSRIVWVATWLLRGREREKERERERERERDRQTDRETDRHREVERERERLHQFSQQSRPRKLTCFISPALSPVHPARNSLLSTPVLRHWDPLVPSTTEKRAHGTAEVKLYSERCMITRYQSINNFLQNHNVQTPPKQAAQLCQKLSNTIAGGCRTEPATGEKVWDKPGQLASLANVILAQNYWDRFVQLHVLPAGNPWKFFLKVTTNLGVDISLILTYYWAALTVFLFSGTCRRRLYHVDIYAELAEGAYEWWVLTNFNFFILLEKFQFKWIGKPTSATWLRH